MDSNLILKSLSTFGLNSYEAKSYLSLLEKDRLSAVEVAKISGVPRGRVYEILDNLLAKGLCHSIPGKVKYYSAANPTVLREKMATRLAMVESEIDQKKQELRSLQNDADEIIESLVPLFTESRKKNNPLDYIEIIKDPYQSHLRYMQLTARAKKEILAFSKPPYFGSRKQREEQMAQQGGLNGKKDLKLKSVHEIPGNKEEIRWKLENLLRTTNDNDETRVTTKELPMKMAIFDESIVMLPLKDPISSGTSFTTQIVEHADLAKALKILFYHFWEEAEDYHVLEDLLKEDLVKTK